MKSPYYASRGIFSAIFKRSFLTLIIFASLVEICSAHRAPSAHEAEQARKRGDLQERLDFIRQLGNDKVSDELTESAIYKLQAAAMVASGEESQISMAAPASRVGLPSLGSPKTLTVLVDFADYRAPATPSPADFANNIYGMGTQTAQQFFPFESLNRYYYRASEGKLNIQGNVLGWFNLPNNRSFYQPSSNDYWAQNQSIFNILKSAFDYYNPSHDFSQYDNDGDGYIDAVTIMYSGPSGAWASFWWAYQWSFFVSDASNTYWDGKRVKKFVFQFVQKRGPSAQDYNPVVLIHEMGHLLGLPDYYDYTPNSGSIGGVGGLDVMHANRGNHNAFSRWLLDWITPEVIGSGSPSIRTLNASGDLSLTNNKAVVIFPQANYSTSGASAPFGEFFVVENRFRTGNDGGQSFMPADGLLVWHVSSELSGGNFKNDNSDTNPKLLRLVQADGLNQIENQAAQADAGDYFNTGKTFSSTSNPNSNRYNGLPSNVFISNISANNKVMTASIGFNVGVSSNATAMPSFSPLGGLFTSNVTVSISCETSGATIRYTTDGSIPGANSPIYSGPISITSTTKLQARAFKSGLLDSVVAVQDYNINSATPLADGVAVSNLSGVLQGARFFVIDVPADQTKLEIKTTGGVGDLDLYVKRGDLPTLSSYDYRPNLAGNTETVTISNPVAGKWYIMLYGFQSYSGATLLADYSKAVVKVGTPLFTPSSGNYTSSLNVIISSTTAGAAIRYTTDKMEPTANSPIYSSPISVNSNIEIRAKAFLAGLENSDTAIGIYNITGSTGNITTLSDGFALSNRAGAQNSMIFYKIEVPSEQTNLKFKISGGTGDCDLYVRRGSLPTLTQFDYRPYLDGNEEEVNITNPQPGTWYVGLYGYYSYSAVSLLADYSKILGDVAAPVFSPAPGVYSSSQNITISSSTPGAIIRFTTNGSAPSSSSPVYNGPIGISSTTTIKAQAYKTGYNDSPLSSGNYTIATGPSVVSLTSGVAVPVSDTSPNTKFYTIKVPQGTNKLTIKTSGGTGDCDLYVKSGSLPSLSSYEYASRNNATSEMVEIASPTPGDWFIMLHAYSTYSQASLIATNSVNVTQIPAPVITPSSGNFSASPLLANISAQQGASIYYTTDNSTPTPSSTLYTGSVELSAPLVSTSLNATSATITLKAIAIQAGYANSPVVSQNYFITSNITTISANQAIAVDQTNISSKRYFKLHVPAGNSMLRISTSGGTGNSDMFIRRGGIPTESIYDYKPGTSGNSEMLIVTNPEAGDWYIMLLASSPFSGVTLSTNLTAALPTVATPTFGKPSGNYTSSVTTGISTTTPESVIRFTTDGSEPSSSSTVFTSNLTFTTNTTLKAKAFKNLFNPSATATANYTITQSPITILENGIPKTGLSGVLDGVAYFKITVPTGQKRLDITVNGTVGDCDLFVRKGSLPTISEWNFKSTNVGSNETLFINLGGESSNSTVTTLAGWVGNPVGAATDGSGNVYVADYTKHNILKITASGNVTTLAGSGSIGSADGHGTAASFNYPLAVAVDGSGNVYVADGGNRKIRKITASGNVTTLAGSGSIGSVDGQGTEASFGRPWGVSVDGTGNVYVADTQYHKIRKITASGNVTTLAGSGIAGSTDGQGTGASFYSPTGVAVDASGNVYVADISNHKIRKITASGNVTTLAGSGIAGSTDGQGTGASFKYPAGVAVDTSGNVYVADTQNHKIRKITASGNVTTIAGSGSAGSADGQGAAAGFNHPYGVAVNGVGEVFVGDYINNKIRKISASANEMAGEYFIMLRGASAYSSATLLAKYWAEIPVAAIPNLSPGSSNFTTTISVSMTSNTTSSQIRYTADGSEPSESSALYTAPLALSSSTTLKAKAFRVGYTPSPTATANYTKDVITPLADGVAKTNLFGLAGTSQYFSINVTQNQSKLLIKTTGSVGDCDLYVKYGAIPTIQSHEFKSTLSGSSEIVEVDIPQAGNYFIMLRGTTTYSGLQLLADHSVLQVDKPTITPASGTYNSSATVSMQVATPGSVIRYTTDNSTPSGNSTSYSSPITVNSTTTIKAIAFKQNYTNSEMASATYTIPTITGIALENSIPKLNLSGTFQSEQYFYIDVPSGNAFLKINISGGSGDCDLYVRKDSLPTKSNYDYRPYLDGNNEQIIVSAPATGRYYIMLHGYSPYSGLTLVASYSNTLGKVATPVFSPANATSVNPLTVNIYCQTVGASIRYTTDNSTPTGSSALYTTPINLSANTTLKAIATLANYTQSDMATSNFTITGTIITPLMLNIPKTNLSGAANGTSLFKLTIPANTYGAVVVKTSGGTGDCDLYIKKGSVSTLSTWDYRAYTNGNNEEVILQNVQPGDEYFVLVHGFANYSAVTLSATPLSADIIEVSLPYSNENSLSLPAGSKLYAKCTIPNGKSKLIFKTNGGSGDCDIYIRQNTIPTKSAFLVRSISDGNEEEIVINNPPAGVYYVMLFAFEKFSGLDVEAYLE